MLKPHEFYFGIDTGVNTGLALWDKKQKRFQMIETLKIHQAVAHVQLWKQFDICVRVEDARQRTWFGKTGKERLKGAGSVERDCKIWEDFLSDLKIDFEMVHPKNNKTKLDAGAFKKITGWAERTSVHGRDAAMLVFGI